MINYAKYFIHWDSQRNVIIRKFTIFYFYRTIISQKLTASFRDLFVSAYKFSYLTEDVFRAGK